MDKLNIQNMLKFLRLLPILLLTSCIGSVQYSYMTKLKESKVNDNNTALIAISAGYKFKNTLAGSISKYVTFRFKEVSSGKIISPDYRDKTNTNLYFNVPPGTYKVSLIMDLFS